MQLNFSLKRAWNDLFLKEQYIIQFLSIAALITLCVWVSNFPKMENANHFSYYIIGTYFCLMTNNIIKGSKNALEDIFTPFLNFIRVSIGLMFLLIVYILIFLIIYLGVLFFIDSILKLSFYPFGIALLMVMFLIFSINFTFARLLFSEKFSFKDGFNLKKAIISFRRGMKEYLIIFAIYILINCIIFAIVSYLNSLSFNPLDNHFKITLQVQIFWGLATFILDYFYNHILAQTYKYTLSEINLTVN